MNAARTVTFLGGAAGWVALVHLALAGVLVGAMSAASGSPGLAAMLAFGSCAAVIGAHCARAGGMRRERC